MVEVVGATWRAFFSLSLSLSVSLCLPSPPPPFSLSLPLYLSLSPSLVGEEASSADFRVGPARAGDRAVPESGQGWFRQGISVLFVNCDMGECVWLSPVWVSVCCVHARVCLLRFTHSCINLAIHHGYQAFEWI
jgi:hypothetical protein